MSVFAFATGSATREGLGLFHGLTTLLEPAAGIKVLRPDQPLPD